MAEPETPQPHLRLGEDGLCGWRSVLIRNDCSGCKLCAWLLADR
jgi:hypothetical protein